MHRRLNQSAGLSKDSDFYDSPEYSQLIRTFVLPYCAEMIHTSEIMTTPPETFRTELQKQVYKTLDSLSVPFWRIDNDPAVTMEDCRAIDERLDVSTVKTLLLCNRQQTMYYLYVTAGDKPFVTKDFGHALGISRVSFAPQGQLVPMLGTVLGATTVFSTLLAPEGSFTLVMDKEVTRSPWYGCTDGTTTCYMKIRTADLMEKILPTTAFTPILI